jgi:hypothetical protein
MSFPRDPLIRRAIGRALLIMNYSSGIRSHTSCWRCCSRGRGGTGTKGVIVVLVPNNDPSCLTQMVPSTTQSPEGRGKLGLFADQSLPWA